MDEDPPDADPVGAASDQHDSDLMEAISEAMNNDSLWNPTLGAMQEDIEWVKRHIANEPDLEYLRGEVRRVQIVLDEWGEFHDASVEMLKTPMGLNIMRPMWRSLTHTQRLLDIAFEELRMGDGA